MVPLMTLPRNAGRHVVCVVAAWLANGAAAHEGEDIPTPHSHVFQQSPSNAPTNPPQEKLEIAIAHKKYWSAQCIVPGA